MWVLVVAVVGLELALVVVVMVAWTLPDLDAAARWIHEGRTWIRRRKGCCVRLEVASRHLWWTVTRVMISLRY